KAVMKIRQNHSKIRQNHDQTRHNSDENKDNYNEDKSVIKNNDLSDLEHDDGSMYNSVVAVQENKKSGFYEEKLRGGEIFKSWEEALNVITIYAQQKGFGLRKGCSEKTSNEVICKRTIDCEHSGEYKPRNKQLVKETNTKYMKCPWHINLSQSTKDNPHSNIYITTLSNTHNHRLSLNRERFFNGIEFTQEMCKCVEFYVNVIKLKPLQIKKALEQEFLDHEIYLSEVHKATAKFYSLFPEVDKALSHFLTPAMLKVQHIKVKSCLNYQASSITKAELIKYQEPELDTIQFIEDDEDVMQVSVNYVLRNVDVNRIEKTWAIRTITALKFSDLQNERKEDISE
ncbi:10635_t:CDS:2, partial [Cetraspora pellucida]